MRLTISWDNEVRFELRRDSNTCFTGVDRWERERVFSLLMESLRIISGIPYPDLPTHIEDAPKYCDLRCGIGADPVPLTR